jgi:hypothetical protein
MLAIMVVANLRMPYLLWIIFGSSLNVQEILKILKFKKIKKFKILKIKKFNKILKIKKFKKFKMNSRMSKDFEFLRER